MLPFWLGSPGGCSAVAPTQCLASGAVCRLCGPSCSHDLLHLDATRVKRLPVSTREPSRGCWSPQARPTLVLWVSSWLWLQDTQHLHVLFKEQDRSPADPKPAALCSARPELSPVATIRRGTATASTSLTSLPFTSHGKHLLPSGPSEPQNKSLSGPRVLGLWTPGDESHFPSPHWVSHPLPPRVGERSPRGASGFCGLRQKWPWDRRG